MGTASRNKEYLSSFQDAFSRMSKRQERMAAQIWCSSKVYFKRGISGMIEYRVEVGNILWWKEASTSLIIIVKASSGVLRPVLTADLWSSSLSGSCTEHLHLSLLNSTATSSLMESASKMLHHKSIILAYNTCHLHQISYF